MVPADDVDRKRIQQHLPKLSSVHLRAILSCNVIIHQEQFSMLVVDPAFLILVPGDALELGGQSGALDRVLTRLRMHVERPSLLPDPRGRFALEDYGIQAVEMQNASEGESARTGSDDGNARFSVAGHEVGCYFSSWHKFG